MTEMADVVLRVKGLKVAYGGLLAARSARPGDYRSPPSPSLPLKGEGARMAAKAHG